MVKIGSGHHNRHCDDYDKRQNPSKLSNTTNCQLWHNCEGNRF